MRPRRPPPHPAAKPAPVALMTTHRATADEPRRQPEGEEVGEREAKGRAPDYAEDGDSIVGFDGNECGDQAVAT